MSKSSGHGHSSKGRRPKKHEEEEHENHERWLVSYADMLTLLFALFVVLYAMSQVDITKFNAFSQGLQQGFGAPVTILDDGAALETPAEDPFLKRGLQMSIDGTDPEDLRAIMEGEIAAKKAEDKVAAKFFTGMGGYAPTVGIIGTVVGLIHVLENLDKPETLGPLIAGAFVATLWGVLSANFFWLPMAAKITRTSDLQAAQMELLVEGIAEIQAGTSPRTVRAKLSSLVPPSEQREAA